MKMAHMITRSAAWRSARGKGLGIGEPVNFSVQYTARALALVPRGSVAGFKGLRHAADHHFFPSRCVYVCYCVFLRVSVCFCAFPCVSVCFCLFPCVSMCCCVNFFGIRGFFCILCDLHLNFLFEIGKLIGFQIGHLSYSLICLVMFCYVPETRTCKRTTLTQLKGA